ncbi:trehalose-phosphatase [Tahibacter amnicola]|uniref:Trehalose 6-phosphate phosphatase n=1 Tax=Tahibacter amnicola TaxID=2976241 RepID=A0ABY6B8Z7_9GAMM|nr:trehalose-phosphatase [Tahibacter amnicola]UXI66531.1 trehalose-phosphatase [Tahibacter amnicola]
MSALTQPLPQVLLAPPAHPQAQTRWAVFLDLDGTLVPFAPAPDLVVVDEGLRQAVHALHQALGGAVAIVSGRRRADLVAYFGETGLRLMGEHGADGAGLPAAEIPANLRSALHHYCAAHPPLLVEDKGATIAVHYRICPEKADALIAHMSTLREEMATHYELLRGDHVFEFRPRGITKAAAIARCMQMDPFRDRIPVMVGDDVTDEDAFAEVQVGGGFGIIVGPRRPTLAEFALPDPRATRQWLDNLLSHLRERAA